MSFARQSSENVAGSETIPLENVDHLSIAQREVCQQ